VLAATTAWWLVVIGAICVVAAWYYTGGSRPYGYRGLGEVMVFVFFGLVAVGGTTYVQTESWSWSTLVAAVGIGSLACAILVANNLRDLPTDAHVGKHTLAVRLGDARSRALYAALVVVPLLLALAVTPRHPFAALALLSAVVAWPALRVVRGGARGLALIPVLRDTGRAELAYGVLLAVGLWIS
jgi:1,4-dihydroxy-2-naphthoate octaprenyltransferase